MKNLIEKYINKIKENDITSFALQNGIHLTEKETQTLYMLVKEKYEILLYGDAEKVFENFQNHFSKENYQKIKDLFLNYKKKYSAYL